MSNKGLVALGLVVFLSMVVVCAVFFRLHLDFSRHAAAAGHKDARQRIAALEEHERTFDERLTALETADAQREKNIETFYSQDYNPMKERVGDVEERVNDIEKTRFTAQDALILMRRLEKR